MGELESLSESPSASVIIGPTRNMTTIAPTTTSTNLIKNKNSAPKPRKKPTIMPMTTNTSAAIAKYDSGSSGNMPARSTLNRRSIIKHLSRP